MKVYTYSQARQKLAKILEEARLEGEVLKTGDPDPRSFADL